MRELVRTQSAATCILTKQRRGFCFQLTVADDFFFLFDRLIDDDVDDDVERKLPARVPPPTKTNFTKI